MDNEYIIKKIPTDFKTGHFVAELLRRTTILQPTLGTIKKNLTHLRSNDQEELRELLYLLLSSGAARVFIAGVKHIGFSRNIFLDHALYFGYKCDQLYRLTSRSINLLKQDNYGTFIEEF